METKTALVCIAKGENRYIREWCEWHKNIGFDEIYIYDNNLVGERIDEAVGDLPYVHINNRYRNALQRNVEIQLKCYNEWYRAHRGDFTHFAFLDCDEFLNVSDDFNGLKDYIARVVKNAEGTRLYWKCHSDSGNLRYEDKPVRERFPQVVEPKDGRYFYKMLFSTGREDFKMINVHFSNHLPNIIDCNGNRINYSQSTYARDGVVYDCAWVDHYITKSAEEYFRNKRGKKDDARRLTVGFFFNFNEHTEEKDRYVAELVGIDVATVAKSNAGALEVHIGRKPETVVLDGMLEDTVKVLPQKQAEAPKVVAGQEPKPAQVGEYPEGVSVCISAYQTQDYIEECLDSVEAQTWFKSHSNWEVLLGIDGCEKTLEKVRDIMHKYRNLHVFMMDENVGTYVTCNTIMKQAKYKWLLRFDSDDVMFPNMVEELINFVGNETNSPDLVTPLCTDNVRNMIWAEGQIFIKNEIFIKYGGFAPFKCGCDTELKVRTKNKIKQMSLRKTLFYRRIRTNSLTKSQETGIGSKYREQVKKYIKDVSPKTPIIKTKTITFRYIHQPQIIISFTTWKKRHNSAAKMLEHLKKQTLKPNKIVCWLSSDEYNGKNIPQSLKPFADENYIEIKWIAPNTYCHKRYEIFKEHNGDYVFLIDDDIYYEPNYIETMYEAAKKHKNNIICYIGNYVEFINKERELLPLKENPSIKNTILSGLSCYPPNTFPMEYFNDENIKVRDKITPKCDDSLLRLYAIKNNIPVFCIYDRTTKRFRTIPNTQSVGIWETENKKTVNGLNKQTMIFKNLIRTFNIEEKCKTIWTKMII